MFWYENILFVKSVKRSYSTSCSNKELKNSNLPDEIRIGAVLRDDKVIIPRSNFVFQKDDRVVFLAKKDSISVVENIFRISSI